MDASNAPEPVLQVRDLEVQFRTSEGIARAVDRVSFEVAAGETLAVVGESGCGKSVTALSILRLIPDPPGRIAGGSVKLAGRELTTLSDRRMRDVRGNEISMIFQEPMTALNPVLTIGEQIAESAVRHEGLSRAAAMERAVKMLEKVRVPEARRRARQYPHQLSGGMRQRAMIAIALACGPRVLIADEPTTALDVTIQAQILDLILDLQTELGAAVILITHDLGVVAEVAQRVVVMYAGRKVEEAPVESLFERPMHPYTVGLMRSVPRLDEPGDERDDAERGSLAEIPGIVPPLTDLPPGCAFAPRCPRASARCEQRPPYREHAPGHWAACWHPENAMEDAL